MSWFREGPGRRARRTRQRSPLGGLLLVGLVLGGTGCAGVQRSAGGGSPMAVPMEPPPFIESSYVGLVEVSLDEIVAEDDSIALTGPSEEPRAAVYARKYDISPDLALEIVESAIEAGVDPDLAFRLVRVESVFKVSARGPQGALGLTQLMPRTARSLDRSLDTEREILDPETNLRTGLGYLRQMIERYDDVRLGLLAYNRGQTAVDRALRRGADPENGYSHKVLGTRGSNPYIGSGLIPGTRKASKG
jgi:hypothetical protein